MTDARLPDRWLHDRRLSRLSDRDFRSFAYALMWSVGNRTDGVIESDDFSLIPHFSPGSVGAFVAQGLWTPLDYGGWVFADWVATQTTRAEHEILDNARVRQRQKKARQRAKRGGAKSAATGDVSGDSTGVQHPGPVPGDVTGVQHRLGQARQGTPGDEGAEVLEPTRNSRDVI
jgi:hypothetical protein